MKTFRCFQYFIIVLLILLIPVLAHAVVLYPRGNTVKFAWNDYQEGIEHYEVILIRSITNETYGPYITYQKEIEVVRPRSGIYEMKVRGYRGGQYSDWASSLGDDAMLFNGTLGTWKVLFKPLAPPGPIIIY